MTDARTPHTTTDHHPERPDPALGDRGIRLAAFVVLALAWVGFLAFGQVHARFWIRNEFQLAWKSVTGIWRVALGELPGGALLQSLVLAAIVVVVLGVIGCLYLLLVADDDTEADLPAN